MDTWTQRDGEDEMNWESSVDVHTLPRVKEIASGKLLYSTGSSAQCCVMTLLGGIRGQIDEGEDICKCVADSLHCTAETNTTL